MLPPARIAEVFNHDSEENYQINSKAIGKAAASLSLKTKHMPDGKSRSVVISKADIARLKSLIDDMSETSET